MSANIKMTMIDKIINNAKKAALLLGSNKQSTISFLTTWENSLENPYKYYLAAYRYFKLYLHKDIRSHKKYFQENRRGFGEEAFHTMWYLLFTKFQFKEFLEIGVYRGQVISLISLLASINKSQVFVYGIAPFNKSGDAVSSYIDIDYKDDINLSFNWFSLNPPNLLNAYSTDKNATDLILSKEWDCIYIDGSHDYEIVLKDWDICRKCIKIGGIIVMDDASLYTDFNNPSFAFKGHPGPSKVADEVDKTSFHEIMRVGHNRVFKRIK